MNRILLVALCLCSFAAHAEPSKARIIYDPVTLKINRVIHVDDDKDLAPHLPHGKERIFDIPIGDYNNMLIHCGAGCVEDNWIDLHKFERYLRDNLPIG